MLDNALPPIVIIPYIIRLHQGKPTLFHPVPDEHVAAIDPHLDTEAGAQSKFCFEIQNEEIHFTSSPVTWRDAPLPSGKNIPQPPEVAVEVQGDLLTITVTVPSPLADTITHYFDINVHYEGDDTTLSIWKDDGPQRVDPTIVEKPAEGPPAGHGKGEGRP